MLDILWELKITHSGIVFFIFIWIVSCNCRLSGHWSDAICWSIEMVDILSYCMIELRFDTYLDMTRSRLWYLFWLTGQTDSQSPRSRTIINSSKYIHTTSIHLMIFVYIPFYEVFECGWQMSQWHIYVFQTNKYPLDHFLPPPRATRITYVCTITFLFYFFLRSIIYYILAMYNNRIWPFANDYMTWLFRIELMSTIMLSQ